MGWYSIITITLDDGVKSFDKKLTIDIVGDPEPIAQALADGRFVVSYEITETVTKIVEVPRAD